jgi:hypothetical protein
MKEDLDIIMTENNTISSLKLFLNNFKRKGYPICTEKQQDYQSNVNVDAKILLLVGYVGRAELAYALGISHN